MTDKEAMKLALDALENQIANVYDTESNAYKKCLPAITALKERLAQPEQEPVAWFSPSGNLYKTRFHATANGEQVVTPLYTTPPQRTEQSGWRKKQIDDAEEEAWKEMEKKAVYSPFIVSELWRLSK